MSRPHMKLLALFGVLLLVSTFSLQRTAPQPAAQQGSPSGPPLASLCLTGVALMATDAAARAAGSYSSQESECLGERDPLPRDQSRSLEGNQESAFFGISVSTAGNVNGDSYSDIIIGAPDYQNDQFKEGAIFIYLGAEEQYLPGRLWAEEGNHVNSDFGLFTALAGDVNGDGYSDVIVGDPGYDQGVLGNIGRTIVFLGSPVGQLGTAWTWRGAQNGEQLGASVAGVGDVNGDGYSDVLVGSNRYDGSLGEDQGRVLLFLGSSQGLAATPAWSMTGAHERASLYVCSPAGDMNQDGFDDVLISATGFDGGRRALGRVYLYHGTPDGLAAEPAWFTDGFQRAACFGCRASMIGDVNGDGHLDVAISSVGFDVDLDLVDAGRVDVYLGSDSGLATVPAWTVVGDAEEGSFGEAIAGGDVDGDGFADLLVGASYNPVQVDFDRGRVFLFRGSPSGLSSAPDWSVETDQPPVEGLVSRFGRSLSAAGDLNGDGYPDVLIGESHFTKHPGQEQEGRVLVHLGRPRGSACAPEWRVGGAAGGAELGHALSAGDVDGDGHADVLVGAPRAGADLEGRVELYRGSPSGAADEPSWSATGAQPKARFGASVCAGGDVTGDGYDDVLVGAPGYSSGGVEEGRAFLFAGGPHVLDGPGAAPLWSFGASDDGAQLGHSVAIAGDVDGDGFADVVVGAPGMSRVYLFLGRPHGPRAGPSWTAEVPGFAAPGAQCGWSVAGAGDVNGDGYADVLVGAPGVDGAALDEGRVHVYLGARDGRLRLARVLSGPAESARFGHAVASAGDVDGDGFADVLVGAPLHALVEPEQGLALLYRGSPAGTLEAPGWSASGAHKYARLGWSVATAGDTDGDGFSDLIAGAPGPELHGSGDALLFRGSPAGPEPEPALVVEEHESGARAGLAVAGARDVDGDGFGDFLIGAPGFTAAGLSGGEVRLHLGFAGGAPRSAPRQLRVSGAPLALGGTAGARAAFRIRARFARDLAGIAWARPGATRAWLQWEVAELGLAFDGVPDGESAPQVVTGLPLEFEERIDGLEHDTPYRWRARFRTDHPLFPVSAWFTAHGASATESMLRTGRNSRAR